MRKFMNTCGVAAAVGISLTAMIGSSFAQTNGHTAPSSVAQAPASSLANFRGDWVGESTAKRSLRLVVTDTEVTFYYSGQKAAMMPPVVEGNKMVIRFAVADGYIQLDKKGANELAWYYQGNAQTSNATLRLSPGGAAAK
jgi:hypothetical protein